MATKHLLNPEVFNRQELSRRWALAAEPQPDDARGPRLMLLLRELAWPIDAIRCLVTPVQVAPARRKRTVMLLPGFGAHPLRMRWMARQLERAGHTAKRWGPGANLGATKARMDAVEARLLALYESAGAPVHLVGWSLGGVIARELAKRHPDKIAKVITMGSPFSGSPRANNGWRAYHLIAGHRVDEPEFEVSPAVKPPVETVALWSPRDGVVHPRCAAGKPGERDRAIALRCTHTGFVIAPVVIETVLKELDLD